MKMFTDRKYSGKVVMMFISIMLGIAGMSYAGNITVPNTFTSGTAAKASEVNANFSALANAMPAVKSVLLNSATLTTITGAALQNIQVNLPAAGQVVVNATGEVCQLAPSAGSIQQHGIILCISKTPAQIWWGATNGTDYCTETRGNYFMQTEQGDANYPNLENCIPFSLNGVYSEASAGSKTYFFNAKKDTGYLSTGTTDLVQITTITATYFPNTM
jgi:hypothetical protein